MDKIFPKRKQILEFIAAFVRDKGYSPSVRDITKGCGISSPSIVQYHLNILEQQGYMHRQRELSRSIKLTDSEKGTPEVPLLGTIAAGEPIPVPCEETWGAIPKEMVEVPRKFIQGQNRIYALKVRGKSMVDALIDDGDIVLLEATNAVEDGDTVAAWLVRQEEATLKKFYREQGQIRLQPANPSMQPIYVDAEQVQVQGRVVGVIRYSTQQSRRT